MSPETLSIDAWPTGVTEDAIMLSLDPKRIAARKKITFVREQDDLDEFEVALLSFGQIVFALQSYKHAPISGTVLVTREDDHQAVKTFLDWFRPTRSELKWVLPTFRMDVESSLRKSTSTGWVQASAG